MNMKIDKRNGDVAFSEDTHTYWNVNDNETYISVTTLIHKFTQPFDKEFWSAYKALEKLIPSDSWRVEKKYLLDIKQFDKELLDLYNISENDFNSVQQNILDEWDKKNKDACERGTKIHLDMENSFYKKSSDISLQKFGIGGKFVCKKDYPELDLECGIYPEYLIHYEEDGLRVAGQIDLLVKNGNEITIGDWKTNAKIDLKSGFDTKIKSNVKMLYPLNNLMDCNFYHYSMQLSTYAYMLQKLNHNFIIKDLFICHFDHDGNETIYHCDYLKKEVENMLYFYKKELIKDKLREKRKPIEY